MLKLLEQHMAVISAAMWPKAIWGMMELKDEAPERSIMSDHVAFYW
jgi:hypothetical protein